MLKGGEYQFPHFWHTTGFVIGVEIFSKGDNFDFKLVPFRLVHKVCRNHFITPALVSTKLQKRFSYM